MQAHIRFIAFVLAALLATPAAFADDIPRDTEGFTAYAAGLLRSQVPDKSVVVKGPLTLGAGIGDAQLQANLDRVFAYCKQDTDGCADELDAYVKGVAEVLRGRKDLPARESVMLVIRVRKIMEQMQRSLATDSPIFQAWPLADGRLVAIPVLDSPRTIKPLTEKDNKAFNLSAEEIHRLALANTWAALRPLMEVAKVAGHDGIEFLTGDSWQPSRLAFPDSWAPLAEAQGGKLIVSVPTKDTVLYIGEDDFAAIQGLRAVTREVMESAPDGLSDTLLRWTPTGWVVVE